VLKLEQTLGWAGTFLPWRRFVHAEKHPPPALAASVHQTFSNATETAAPDAPARHIVIVLNAKAGALLGRDGAADQIESAFRETGARVDSIPPGVGALPERIAQARDAGADWIVVAGGDGTVACAAQCVTEKSEGAGSPALAIIPGGTMNLLAKDLGLPIGDPNAAIQALMAGHTRSIDVGCVSASGGPAHVFTCASMLGTPTSIGRHREAGRRAGNGPLAWLHVLHAGWRAWRRNRSRRLTLVCDGKRIKVRTPSVTITVNPLDDQAGRLFGRSCLDGGELAIYVVRHNTPWRQLRVLVHALTSGSLHDREIDVLRARDLVIDSRRAALHVLVDGEARLLAPPLRYSVRPRALSVIVPA
jgi:diacylglycerol kinase family enzyme